MKKINRKIRFDDSFAGEQLEIPFEEFAPKPSRVVDEVAAAIPSIDNKDNSQSQGKASDSSSSLLYYISLASGSSGNCCYLGSKRAGIIIDAGIRSDHIELQLRANGIDMKAVKGLLITHDHTDHVKFSYNLLRNNQHINLYCTNRVLNGMLRRHSLSKRLKEYHMPIFKEIPFKVGDFEITAFDVPHDGTDNMGFSIEFDSRRFVLATDLGAVSDRARHYMSHANYLVIESNYDLPMLVTGRYPEYLKSRIRMGNGHLDNTVTADFLAEIASPNLKYVFLCHLSEENNTPELAESTSRKALEEKGWKIGDCSNSLEARQADIQLMALPRQQPSPLFVFRPFAT